MTSETAIAVRCRLRAAAIAFGTGLLMLGLVPKIHQLESADRQLLVFLLSKTGTGKEMPIVVGTGDFDNPRAVRGLPATVPEERIATPRFLEFTDDQEDLFESSSPSPADFAVILNNLFELGHRKLAIAMPLAWKDPPRAVATMLDYQLGRFTPAIVGVPLVRGITPKPIPPAFERLSVPVGAVRGEVRSLPIVNQLAIPNPRFGGDSTWAAFTRLENEKAPEFGETPVPVAVPLLARWGERVVVALPLAVMMARFDVPAGKVVINPGRDIRLGKVGPIIPIDEFGRTMVAPGATENIVVVPAEETVRPPGEAAPATLKPGEIPLVLRDERTKALPAEKEYSRHLASVLIALDHAPRSDLLSLIPRPHTAIEVSLVAVFAGWVAWICCLPAKFRHPLFFFVVAVAFGLSWLMLAMWHTASPPLAMLAAPIAGWLACLVPGCAKRTKNMQSCDSPEN